MKLTTFISKLIQQGEVKLEEEIFPFETSDLAHTGTFLHSFYTYDIQEMPRIAPNFHEEAAVWAASYIYRALQFVLVRKHSVNVMQAELKPFPHSINAEVVYSADLCMRYLPQIFRLAKGLSPEDPLVENLLKTASQWPFSSVGIEIEEEAALPKHPSLEIAYADRITRARDLKRSKLPQMQNQIRSALGAHAQDLWPTFQFIAQNEK